VYEELDKADVRVVLDDRNEKVGYKIREAQQVDRAPYMLIIGAKEEEEGTVSVRSRDTGETVSMPLADFVAKVTAEIKNRTR
jgi:threonyl-tRNA synthetase